MEEIEDMLRNLQIEQFEKNSEHWVNVTHIIDPHHFYTRLIKHNDVIKKIETCISSSSPDPSRLNPQDIVLFNMNGDSSKPKYARGKIISSRWILEDNAKSDTLECELFAVDYGNFEKNVPLERIRVCDGLFANIPPLAVCCRLAFCVPIGGTWGEAIEAFKYYVGDECAKMIVEENTIDNLIVKLYNSCPSDMGTLLVLTGLASLAGHNDISRLQTLSIPRTVAHYNFVEWKTGAVLHVRVLSGKSLEAFYVAEMTDYAKYWEERENINLMSSSAPAIDKDVKCGDLVCVENVYGKYERGVIRRFVPNSNRASVLMVDSGQERNVGFTFIKKLPQCLASRPVVSIFCSVKHQAPAELHVLLQPGRQHIIKIEKPGHEFESPNIVKIVKVVQMK